VAGDCESGDEVAGCMTVKRVLSSQGAVSGPLEMPFRLGS